MVVRAGREDRHVRLTRDDPGGELSAKLRGSSGMVGMPMGEDDRPKGERARTLREVRLTGPVAAPIAILP
jgi:hypothetical protein